MRRIVLSGKNGLGKFTLVDDNKYTELSKRQWHLGRDGYVKTSRRKNNGKYEPYSIHRFLMGDKKGYIIDHINGDKLDNRLSNLRYATQSQNHINSIIRPWNKSGYKGVIYESKKKYWRAIIGWGGKNIYLGYFKDKISAAKRYNEEAKKLYGQFARLNTINL